MFKKVCTNIINIIFALITGILFFASIGTHCEIDTASFLQLKHLVSHRIYIFLPLSILFIIALIVLYQLLHNLSSKNVALFQKTTKIIGIVEILLVILLSSFWIVFNDTIPHSDQAILFKEAQKLAGFSSEPFNTFYMGAYDRQRGLVFLMALLLKIFGNSQLSFRLFNILMIVLLFFGIKLLINASLKDNITSSIAIILLVLFYPIIIYTCYLYGTLSAVTFEVYGFYGIIQLLNKGQYRYAILSAISFTLGAFMHQSALIGLVAGCILLIIFISKNNFLKHILSIAIIVSIYLSANALVNYTFSAITGCPNNEALPASATLYMGLTSTEESGALGGPGSSDASEMVLYQKNDGSASGTNELAVSMVNEVINEYMNGTRSFDFFAKKIEHQWLEPSFDAHRIILLNNTEENEPVNSAAYTKFYYSSLRNVAPKFLLILLISVYALACINSIGNLVMRKTNTLNVLIRLFFIGGFTFQIFWESLSRYCFSYYVLLILEAACGVSMISHLRKSN